MAAWIDGVRSSLRNQKSYFEVTTYSPRIFWSVLSLASIPLISRVFETVRLPFRAIGASAALWFHVMPSFLALGL